MFNLKMNLLYEGLSSVLGYAGNKALVEKVADPFLAKTGQKLVTENADLIGAGIGIFIGAGVTMMAAEQLEKLPGVKQLTHAIHFDPKMAGIGALTWAAARGLAGLINRAQGLGPLKILEELIPYLPR